ncbi:hypothetical protein N9D56_01060 [Methylophilaceae bacterium]|jgi:hypothetical protein|nr:hypothetical protein [Methylophilaceae bacterium]
MDKSNIQKITKLSYVLILGCLSYYLLIGKYYDNHSIGDWAMDLVKDKQTKHWYQQCPNDKNRYGYSGCDTRRFTKIQLDEEEVDVSDKTTWRKIDDWNRERSPDEFIYVYRNDRSAVLTSGKYLQEGKKIVWGLFIFSLFLIWISRGISIPILNKVRSIINSGWDKI